MIASFTAAHATLRSDCCIVYAHTMPLDPIALYQPQPFNVNANQQIWSSQMLVWLEQPVAREEPLQH